MFCKAEADRRQAGMGVGWGGGGGYSKTCRLRALALAHHRAARVEGGDGCSGPACPPPCHSHRSCPPAVSGGGSQRARQSTSRASLWPRPSRSLRKDRADWARQLEPEEANLLKAAGVHRAGQAGRQEGRTGGSPGLGDVPEVGEAFLPFPNWPFLQEWPRGTENR